MVTAISWWHYPIVDSSKHKLMVILQSDEAGICFGSRILLFWLYFVICKWKHDNVVSMMML